MRPSFLDKQTRIADDRESGPGSHKRQIEEDDEINGGDAVEYIVGVYKVVGAIGVSGGTGEQDQVVAEAGAAAFK